MHWRRKWQPTPVFLLGESQGWQSLRGCRLWGHTESDTTEATLQQQGHIWCTSSVQYKCTSQHSVQYTAHGPLQCTSDVQSCAHSSIQLSVQCSIYHVCLVYRPIYTPVYTALYTPVYVQCFCACFLHVHKLLWLASSHSCKKWQGANSPQFQRWKEKRNKIKWTEHWIAWPWIQVSDVPEFSCSGPYEQLSKHQEFCQLIVKPLIALYWWQ